MFAPFRRSQNVHNRQRHSLRVEQLEERSVPANLIVNGTFEAGNTGFATDYQYDSTPWDDAQYYLTTDPSTIHFLGVRYGDHTTGRGLMMAANGGENPNLRVWSQ